MLKIKIYILKISRELKTAILVLSSIALLLWGYNFLKGSDLFGSSRKFFVDYENVEGLAPGASVTINGLVVGKVSHINLSDNGKLMVEIIMTNSIEIPKSSKAIIYSPGFIGGKQIAIHLNLEDKNFAEDGDHLHGESDPGMLDSLTEKVEPITHKLDSVLYNVNKLVISLNQTLDPVTQQNLQNAIAELNQTLANANHITQKVDKVLVTNQGKIDGMMTNFNATSKNLNTLSTDLVQADLKATIQKFDNAAANLDKLFADIQNGNGNVGKLMKDENLYNNLNKASSELNMLLQDVKLNPKRYINISVFGKKTEPYVEPVATQQ